MMKSKKVKSAFVSGLIIGMIISRVIITLIVSYLSFNFNFDSFIATECKWDYCETCVHDYEFWQLNREYCKSGGKNGTVVIP